MGLSGSLAFTSRLEHHGYYLSVLTKSRIWMATLPHSFTHAHLFYMSKAFMSTPRIIRKKDPRLDVSMEIEKKIGPILKIRDMVMNSQAEGIPLKTVESKKRDLGLKTFPVRPSTYIKTYPNIFQVYMHPTARKLYCRLTKEAMELIEEERRIYAEQEPAAVERLRKLLMLFSSRQVLTSKLNSVRGYFGFADGFLIDMVPKYPEFFHIVTNNTGCEVLELVRWDETLAISAFEKKSKEEARHMGLGEIETRGQQLAFKLSLSPGMNLRRKTLEILQEWQNLPYISPYQDTGRLKHGTPESEKRNVAVLHEFLWLTTEKKVQLKVISNFRKELGLPHKTSNLVARFPGIFYVTHKGGVQNCILREGYHGCYLVEENPFEQLKAKYAEMVRKGPHLNKSMMEEEEDMQDRDRLDLTEDDSNRLEGKESDDDTASETMALL